MRRTTCALVASLAISGCERDGDGVDSGLDTQDTPPADTDVTDTADTVLDTADTAGGSSQPRRNRAQRPSDLDWQPTVEPPVVE